MTPAEILKAMIDASKTMPAQVFVEHIEVSFVAHVDSQRNAYKLERHAPPDDGTFISYSFKLPPYNDEVIVWSADTQFSEEEATAIATFVITKGQANGI